ncbi:MAG: helix-turn-helix transcriptional regulator [Clostridia bacterium]|nr:helix-turn-helix transcriptional regulator [Clostridia bacterium]
MHLSYQRLWQLLAAKGLHKTDLINLTGLSSRTVAKLTKNESVTTDTLTAICAALSCDLTDIVELCAEQEAASIYEAYLRQPKGEEEHPHLQTVRFSHGGQDFTVHTLKKRAGRHTFIRCHPSGSVVAEQLYPLGFSPASEVTGIFHPYQIEPGRVNILVIPGSPGLISGLDEGVVCSARRGLAGPGLYVMTASALKLFASAP